jgi:CubicO group peptidase (beta-lactamase class C family)
MRAALMDRMPKMVNEMVSDFLQHEIDLGSFPSAQWAAGTVDGIAHEGALGNAIAVPLRIPATLSTIYDCASITKVLVTSTLVLQAVAEGRITLDDEYRGASFRELLTHTSGLKAWLPLYALGDYLETIAREGREAGRGERVMYSDLNFVLLYHAIQEVFGDYVQAARERIFTPLGLTDTCFRPDRALLPRIAATEWGQRFEPQLAVRVGRPIELVTQQPSLDDRQQLFTGPRQGLMWGETNDGNSHHAGGTCGNAGLFSTARDVFRIAQGFARGELVPRELVDEATLPHAGDRGLGWQLRGPGLSPESYGHMGFTGTSVWIDGERIFVLLTNRIHPCAAPIGMHRIRKEFHQRARF